MSAGIAWPLSGVSQTVWYASASDADRHEGGSEGGVHLLETAPAVGTTCLVGFGSSVALQPQQVLWCAFLPPLLCWNGWPADTLDDVLRVALVEVRTRETRTRNPGRSVVNACTTTTAVEVLRTVRLADLATIAAAPNALEWSRQGGLGDIFYAPPHLVRHGAYVLATGTTEADQGNAAVFLEHGDGIDLLLTDSNVEAGVAAGRRPMRPWTGPDGDISRWPPGWRLPPRTT